MANEPQKPAESGAKPEEMLMHISTDFFVKLKEITKQVNHKFNAEDREKLEEVFSLIAKTAFQCMYEDFHPEVVQSATNTCLVPHADRHE